MRTARVTVLMRPEQKAEVEAEAARLGVSSGEFIRLAVEDFAAPDELSELDALTQELEQAIPRMRDDVDAMRASIATARDAVASYRREKAGAIDKAAA